MAYNFKRFGWLLLAVITVFALGHNAWALPGDINQSGRVDGLDLIVFARAFDTSDGQADWNAAADLNGDAAVNAEDLAILRDYFGRSGQEQNCWVTDRSNRQVVKLAGNSGQELVRTDVDGTLLYPRGLWASPSDGSIWAADRGNGWVVHLGADGRLLKTIRGFNYPEAIAFDAVNNRIWVSQGTYSSNSRVYRIDGDAPHDYDVTSQTFAHAEITGFYYPRAVAMDPVDGSCWVADANRNRVVKLAPDVPHGYSADPTSGDVGHHQATLGFYRPSALSVDLVSGSCWVADMFNQQVVRLTAGGFEDLRVDGFYYPTGISVNPLTGNCWVFANHSGQAVKLSPLGVELARVDAFTGGSLTGDSRTPISVDVMTGHVWLADRSANQVVKLAANGQELLRLNGFYSPMGVAAVPAFGGDQAPQAVATVSDTRVDAGQDIVFDASGSTGGGHAIIRYEWDFDGDGSFDTTSTEPAAVHAYPQDGIFTAVLRVTNALWLSATTQTEPIRVGQLQAFLSASPTSGTAPADIDFDLDAVDPVDGRVESFHMDFDGDGVFENQYTSARSITHTYNASGTFDAVLKVVDTGNLTAFATVQVEVLPAAPEAFLKSNPSSGTGPLKIDFEFRGQDGDGRIDFYELDFDGDGTYDWWQHSGGVLPAGQYWSEVSHIYQPAPGEATTTYSAVLRVTDNDGNQATASWDITVNLPAEFDPTPGFSAVPQKGNTPLAVAFDAGASTTPDGTAITGYDWDFGDGNSAQGMAVNHQFSHGDGTPREFTVTLTVTNDLGASAATTGTVTVNPAGTPTAVAGGDPLSGVHPFTVNLNATGSLDDPPGSIVAYEWELDDGLRRVFFQDDMESGPGAWTAEGSWSRTQEDAHSPTYCWTDSPGGNYLDNSDASLISAPIDLGAANPRDAVLLTFRQRTIKEYRDEFYLEISSDDGVTWTTIQSYRWNQPTHWRPETVDISAYGGQTIRIRFRLISGESNPNDGWYIDDVSISQELWQDATAGAGSLAHDYAAPGIYRPRLRVVDDEGNMDIADLTVTLDPGAPVAVAGADTVRGTVPLSVGFTADGSNDANGQIAQYAWDFDAGFRQDAESGQAGWIADPPWAITDSAHHSGNHSWTDDPDGHYAAYSDVSLTSPVFDLCGQDDPELVFWDIRYITSGTSVRVEISTDQGGRWTELARYTNYTYNWAQNRIDLSAYGGMGDLQIRFRLVAGYYISSGWFIDDIEIQGAGTAPDWSDSQTGDTTHTYTQPGSYRALLTVTDDDGYAGVDCVPIQVDAVPQAMIQGPAAGERFYKQNVPFEGYGSDADGSVVLYEWDFDGDGQYDWSSDQNGVTRGTYLNPGSYTAVLRVTDDDGYTGTAPVAVEIIESGPSDLAVSIDHTEGYGDLDVQLDGSAQDPDGTIVRYEWDFEGDGTWDWCSVGPGRVLSTSTQYNATTWSAARTIDGLVNHSSGWLSRGNVTYPQDIVLELARERSWLVDRVAFDVSTNQTDSYWAREVELLVSDTDTRPASFVSAGRFTLSATVGLQSFALTPVQARYAKIRVLSNNGGDNSYVCLGEVVLYSGICSLLAPPTALVEHSFTTVGDYTPTLRAVDDENSAATTAGLVRVLPSDHPARIDARPAMGIPPLEVDFQAHMFDAFHTDAPLDLLWEAAGCGNWHVSQEEERQYLLQTANSGSYIDDDPEHYGCTLLSKSDWADCDVSTDVYSGDDDGIGIMIRYGDADNFYLFQWFRQSWTSYGVANRRQLIKRTPAGAQVLAEDDVAYDSHRWYAISVSAVGTTLSVEIDGQQVFQVTDATHASGRIGPWVNYNSHTRFDDLRVTPPGLTYAWDFGTNNSTTANPQHTFTRYGDHQVTLEVVDGDNIEHTDRTVVHVQPRVAWVADTDHDQVKLLAADGVTVLRTLYGFGSPQGIRTTLDGTDFWVTDLSYDQVFYFDGDVPDGYNVLYDSGFHSFYGGYWDPLDVAPLPGGDGWVVDRYYDRMVRIDGGPLGFYYPMDHFDGSTPNGTGGTPAAVFGVPVDLELENARFDKGFRMGDGRYISLPADTMDGLYDFTVEAWASHDFDEGNHAGTVFCGIRKDYVNMFVLYPFNATTVRVYLYNDYYAFPVPDDPNTSIPIDLNDGALHHYAVTRQGSEVRLYVDGQASADVWQTTGRPFDISTGGLLAGQDANYVGGELYAVSQLEGMLDELRIWNTARTAEEIAATAGSALAGNEAGLAGYWPLDQIDGAPTGFTHVTGFNDPIFADANPADGTCWVTDYGHDDVFRLAATIPDGYNVGTDSGHHTALDGFNNPHDLAVRHSDGTCWVPDRAHDQMVQLAADGSGEVARIGGFSDPIRVAIDQHNGTIWVLDYSTDQVIHLAAAGTPELSRTSGFSAPHDLAVDSASGQVWVGDHNHDEVWRLAPDGGVLSKRDGFNNPYYLDTLDDSQLPENSMAPVIAAAAADSTGGPEGVEVNFTLNASDDSGIATYEWDFDGDGSFDFSSGSSGNTANTYDRFGHFTPLVRVTDDQGLTTVRTLAPISVGETRALITANPMIGPAPLRVYFSGDGFDPQGPISGYSWDYTSDGNQNSTSRTPNTTYNTAGTYVATLTVTAADGDQASDTVVITVSQSPPLAAAAVAPSMGTAPLQVDLTGTGSDPDGNVQMFQWDYDGDGIYDYSSPTESDTRFVYTQPGTYQPTFRVLDNDGFASSDSVQLVVAPPLTADFTVTPDICNIGQTVTFTTTLGPEVVAHAWMFGDMTYGEGSIVSHAYTHKGVATAALEVWDALGRSARHEVPIIIRDTGTPFAVAAADPVSGLSPLTVNLTADASSDPDGSIVQYDWDFGEGHTLNANGYPLHQLFLGTWDATGCGDITSMQAGILTAEPKPGDVLRGRTWTAAYDTDGHFNWDAVFGNHSNAYAYSHIYVYSATPQTVRIKFGADDTARFWVNGTPVFTKDVCGGVVIDAYSFDVAFEQGWNRILTTVSEGTGSWGQAYRITDLADAPLQLPYSLRPLSAIPDFTYSSAASGNTTHTYETPGTYSANLTVTDDQGLTDTQSVEITVAPTDPPTAQAAATPTRGDTPLVVEFSGSGSDNGAIVRYQWDFEGDGGYDWSSGQNAQTTHTYTQPGQFAATLRVTDDEGYTDTDSVTVTAGSYPEARPFAYPLGGPVPLTVNFNSNGFDADGTIVSYAWDLDGDGSVNNLGDLNGDWWPDNPSQISTAFPYTYTLPGTYPATLTVTDNQGLQHSATVNIEVTAAPDPQVIATAQPERGAPPLAVALSAFASDGDGTITAFDWNFGDGNSGSGQTVAHTYNQAGIYQATVTATDNEGNTGTARVYVRALPIDYPTAAAAGTNGSAQSSFTVNFSGTGSDNEGAIVLYEWDFDGDGTYDYQSGTSGNTVHNYTQPGDFEAMLRVTDADGNQDIDLVRVQSQFGITAGRTTELIDPWLGQEAHLDYALTSAATVTVRIANRQFETVRNLVPPTLRQPGAYRVFWDGRADNGQIVPDGVYSMLLDYEVDGVTRSLDLTGQVSLARQEPGKSYPNSFDTLADRPLYTLYSLQKPAETTVYVANWDDYSLVGARVKTVLLREPRPSGTYIDVWDGTNDEGNMAPPRRYVWTVMAWNLPDNAIIVDSRPVISDVSKEPDYFMPSANAYNTSDSDDLTVSFRLSKDATVTAFVQDETDVVVRTLDPQALTAGQQHITWDGRDDAGRLVTPGIYRIGLQATDANGNVSRRVYSVFLVFY